MNNKLNIHWQIRFMPQLGNEVFAVNIYDIDYYGNTPVQIGGSSCPFEVGHDDSTDRYETYRASTGYIHIIVENEEDIQDIFPTKCTDRPVELARLADGAILWHGYISVANVECSYSSTPYILDIPISSTLDTLRYIKYQPSMSAMYFGDIFKNIFGNVRTRKIFFPWNVITTYSAEYLNEARHRVFDGIFKKDSDDNTHYSTDYGEGNNPSEYYSCAEILENISLFFGYQIVEYKDSIFFTREGINDYLCPELDTITDKIYEYEDEPGPETYPIIHVEMDAIEGDVIDEPTRTSYLAKSFVQVTVEGEDVPTTNKLEDFTFNIESGKYVPYWDVSDGKYDNMTIRNGLVLSIENVQENVGTLYDVNELDFNVRIEFGGSNPFYAGIFHWTKEKPEMEIRFDAEFISVLAHSLDLQIYPVNKWSVPPLFKVTNMELKGAPFIDLFDKGYCNLRARFALDSPHGDTVEKSGMLLPNHSRSLSGVWCDTSYSVAYGGYNQLVDRMKAWYNRKIAEYTIKVVTANTPVLPFPGTVVSGSLYGLPGEYVIICANADPYSSTVELKLQSK